MNTEVTKAMERATLFLWELQSELRLAPNTNKKNKISPVSNLEAKSEIWDAVKRYYYRTTQSNEEIRIKLHKAIHLIKTIEDGPQMTELVKILTEPLIEEQIFPLLYSLTGTQLDHGWASELFKAIRLACTDGIAALPEPKQGGDHRALGRTDPPSKNPLEELLEALVFIFNLYAKPKAGAQINRSRPTKAVISGNMRMDSPSSEFEKWVLLVFHVISLMGASAPSLPTIRPIVRKLASKTSPPEWRTDS